MVKHRKFSFYIPFAQNLGVIIGLTMLLNGRQTESYNFALCFMLIDASSELTMCITSIFHTIILCTIKYFSQK